MAPNYATVKHKKQKQTEQKYKFFCHLKNQGTTEPKNKNTKERPVISVLK